MQFDRLAFDSNAAIDLLRPDRPTPPPFANTSTLVMPLFVLAELRLGFSRSGYDEKLDDLIAVSTVIAPDQETVEHYIAARNAILRSRTTPAKREAQQGLGHDIWIAALCLQHELPLLTNDSDFDELEELQIVHW